MVLKGLVSVSISLNFFLCIVYQNHRRIPPESGFERPTVPVWNFYSKYNRLFFFSKRFYETCATVQSVFTCYAVPNETYFKTVLETRIVPLYFCSTFAWTRETIKSHEKLNPNIKKYPTPTRLT